MTQYVTKFEAWRTAAFAQDDNAQQPAGWTARYGGVIADVVRNGSPPTTIKRYGWSGRCVRFDVKASWNLIDADANRANVEVCVGGRSDASDSQDGYISAFVRGDAATTTYYEAALFSGTLRINKVVSGTPTTLASVVSGAAGYAPDDTRMYHIRFRANGSALSAKIWGRDAAEPVGWSITATDGAITAAGLCGAGNGNMLEFFSVGTNGDAALLPKTLVTANDQLCRAMTSGQPVVCTLDIEVPAFTGSTTVAGRVFRRFSNMPYNTGTAAPLVGEVYNARMLAAPSVSREMADLSGGVVKVGGANVALDNADGALDDMFRMRLFRMAAVCRIGLPSWPWYDLLPYHQGVIQDVSDDGGKALTLGIDGTARELDGDVTQAYSTSGVNDKKPLPQIYGKVRNISPVLVDATKLIYQYAADNLSGLVIRDKGVQLNNGGIIVFTDFDAAADTLTTSAPHGLVAGDFVNMAYTSVHPVSGFNSATVWIKTVPATDKITVSLTEGGATYDLTGTSGPCGGYCDRLAFLAYGYTYPIIPPTGCIRLLRQPAGQITIDQTISSTITWANLLKLTGLSSSKFQSSTNHFEPYLAFNLYLKDRQSKLSVLEAMAARGRPISFARNGAMSWRPINFTVIEASFTEADCLSDVNGGVPKLIKTLQPTAGRVGEPNWTVQTPADLAGSVTPANVALYGAPQYYLVQALGIDYQNGLWWGGLVDDPALYRDTLPDKSVGGIPASNSPSGGGGWATLNSNESRQRPAGVYEVTVGFKSLLLDCGDVVSLTHRRHFFKTVTSAAEISPDRLINHARTSTVTASSTYGAGYPASAVINGDRRGHPWGSGGGWLDATASAYPDWLEFDLGAPKIIDAANVFSIQDNYPAPVEPYIGQTFTAYGLTAFQVQYWNGSTWITPTGASVTGNTLVWRAFSFAPTSAQRWRLYITANVDPNSHVAEVELLGAIDVVNQPNRALITKIVDDPAQGRQTLTLYRPMPVLFPAS
jgi:hypothetical protein